MITSRKKGGDYLPVSTNDTDSNDQASTPSHLRRSPPSDSEHVTWNNCREVCYEKFCTKRCIVSLVATLVSMWAVVALVNLARDVVPEMDLVVASKCAKPMQNWDGRLFNYPIWYDYYQDRPSYYNLHAEYNYVGNDTNHHVALQNNAGAKRPVIIFGTHHKTGTFLAKKLFARLCSKMNWCCLFHVTRDSIHAVTAGLQNEPVNAVGHNQWIWNPNDLDIANYRFIHFYRHPFKKVISGYRYHADGTEEWTKKPLTYQHLCSTPLLTSSAPLSSTVVTGTGRPPSPQSEAGVVWEYCEAVHLCETCCRMEHEKEVVKDGKRSIVLQRRSQDEYDFMCDKLGRGAEIMSQALEQHLKEPSKLKKFHHTATPSIQEMLLNSPPAQGILTEAALDYYENLRMATIISETAGDPRTLNVDIDELNSNYAAVTLRMLQHLEGLIPAKRIKELHQDLAFYDLQTSPVYRWSMDNPIVNHVTGTASSGTPAPAPSTPGASGGVLTGSNPNPNPSLKGTAVNSTTTATDAAPTVYTASSTYLMAALRNDPTVTKVYAPILKMMESVLTKKPK